MLRPDKLDDNGRFSSFDNGKILFNKKKNHLPAMGWNSWNAFGSGNTEELTRIMADKIVELGLDKLGYEYVILDDGCYKPERIDGKLSNEENKFPNGFKSLSDYIHSKGLKFGMYNDIGTNLCAGAAVGTCGHERDDAASYIEWGVDFLKVDNCYYPFDNATFSNPENAAFTFAPAIRSIKIVRNEQSREEYTFNAISDGKITGDRAFIENNSVTGIGTYDGTGPEASPVGLRSSELIFNICADNKEIKSVSDNSDKNDNSAEEENFTCLLEIEYQDGKEEGKGNWTQIAVNDDIVFDDFISEDGWPSEKDSDDKNAPDEETKEIKPFEWSKSIKINLKKGSNCIRIMNHRRQENTLNSYARLLKELNELKPENDIIYSACEWGKTHPQNWAYKVCDSWRILNDITFRVGSDGDPGFGAWNQDYTTSVTAQYNKAVIMDEFAGLSKGWNDPDMLMIGMNGLDEVQCRTHMTMWCMMNSPLMLGMDLRRVSANDWMYNIIANKDMISLNQDALGIQAKRIFSTLAEKEPDKEYIRDINRIDVLAKPLSNGDFALSFINVSEEGKNEKISVSIEDIIGYFGEKITRADSYSVKNLWTKEVEENNSGIFEIDGIKACDNVTFRISAIVS
ncbi:glycoside hydrolase family 27 protein [Butyrivibrio sp. LC3010]|uniref:glycoside hydrolase family 27 protein n=1 Tax=Butyrivibrio sp. LC3010 TaxID=1280680 RepID=UPI0004112577|nr:glycoside hydrolase family 27 protein [Butyrivibrio sp. LC3010]